MMQSESEFTFPLVADSTASACMESGRRDLIFVGRAEDETIELSYKFWMVIELGF